MYVPSSCVSLSCTNITTKQYQAIKIEVYSIRRKETASRTRMKINRRRNWVKQLFILLLSDQDSRLGSFLMLSATPLDTTA